MNWTVCISFLTKIRRLGNADPEMKICPVQSSFLFYIPLFTRCVYMHNFLSNKIKTKVIWVELKKKKINLKVSIRSDFSIGDYCRNGRVKSATDGRYICVCLLCIHTLSGFSQHTHTRVCVCVCVVELQERKDWPCFIQSDSVHRTERFISYKLSALSTVWVVSL